MIHIHDTLVALGANELLKGRIGWAGDAMSPYSHDELQAFVDMNIAANVASKDAFAAFKARYDELAAPDKLDLRRWAQAEFVEPTWRNGKTFPRPEWANKHFFPNAPKSGKLLDIAPAHGCHGALLYRDHYGLGLDLYTCDFSPAYNKLLTILGVNVKHVDLRFQKIGIEYFENNEKFDVVTLTEVLEHVDQAAEDRTCDSLHYITRAGSRLLVTFPVKALPHGGIPQPNDPLGHIRQPVVDEVIAKLREFKALERGKFSGGRYDQHFIILERQ